MFLNQIPFADHRALLDPSTADLTGRELEMLGTLGFDMKHPAAVRALRFLRKNQEADGSWYGRWGVNYIYGTWSVLAGLKAIGEDMQAEYVRARPLIAIAVAAAWIGAMIEVGRPRARVPVRGAPHHTSVSEPVAVASGAGGGSRS